MTEPGYTPPDLTLVGPEHTRQYLETSGAVGHEWSGVHTLILTTTGRRSGRPRMSPMIYGRAGDAYVVVASQGGAPTHPLWFLNLLEQPQVEIHVGNQHLMARARVAEGDERERLWRTMTDIWPNFAVYQTRTDREIPVAVLDAVA